MAEKDTTQPMYKRRNQPSSSRGQNRLYSELGVRDLRELLNRKRTERGTLSESSLPPPDPSYSYLDDPLRDNIGENEHHSRGQSHLTRQYQKDRQHSRPSNPEYGSANRGRNPRGGRFQRGGRSRSETSNIRGGGRSRSGGGDIQNPLNIKVQFSTSTGEHVYTLDENTVLPTIKHVPDKAEPVESHVRANNNNYPEFSRGARGRGRGGRYQNKPRHNYPTRTVRNQQKIGERHPAEADQGSMKADDKPLNDKEGCDNKGSVLEESSSAAPLDDENWDNEEIPNEGPLTEAYQAILTASAGTHLDENKDDGYCPEDFYDEEYHDFENGEEHQIKSHSEREEIGSQKLGNDSLSKTHGNNDSSGNEGDISSEDQTNKTETNEDNNCAATHDDNSGIEERTTRDSSVNENVVAVTRSLDERLKITSEAAIDNKQNEDAVKDQNTAILDKSSDRGEQISNLSANQEESKGNQIENSRDETNTSDIEKGEKATDQEQAKDDTKNI